MLLTTIGIVLFAVSILASIALHEIGHLVPAKRFGVKVTQYMVGFGPTAWSRSRGDTEYGVKWIPLGGYIRMIGMYPPKPGEDPRQLRSSSTGPFRAMVDDARRVSMEEVQPGDEDRVFYKLPVHQKIVVMLGGPSMNLVIAIVTIFLVMVGIGLPMQTPKVSQVTACVVGAQEAQQRFDAAKKAGKSTDNLCTPADRQSPAAEAGLKVGDDIVTINGHKPATLTPWNDVQDVIRSSPGRPVALTVERDGQRLDLTVTPVENQRQDDNDPAKYMTVGFLGISPTYEQVRLPATAVPQFLWTSTKATAAAVVRIPQRMVDVWHAAFSGDERDANGPIGIVGVSRIGGEVVSADSSSLGWKAANFLMLVASLNLALFVFNLVPLLPLDGGHVAGALFEGARRQVSRWRHRPDPGFVDVARMLPIAYTVAILLIGMSGLLLYADIVNPVRLNG